MLFSYMLFFSTCIAPVINTTLERKFSSILLRKIFPRNFLYGLILSFLLIIFSFLENVLWSMFFSLIIFTFYLVNLFLIMPRINQEADKFKGKYTNKFKILHLFSVLLYITQMILSTIAILKLYLVMFVSSISY
jgi:hypothetical protein